MLIIGGGNIGFNLAKNIETSFESARVKIIEKDKSRAEYIANELNDTIVINGNGLDEDVLNEANIDEVETVLALTNDDEDNLMVSVIVEKFSKDKRTMALTNKPNYSLLQSSLKIDDLIDPRMSTVSSILKHVHKGTIENAYTISNGEYEVIEADIIETSELINKQLKDSNLPDDIRIGAIVRKNKVSVIGNGVVIDPWALLEEIEEIRLKGIEIKIINKHINQIIEEEYIKYFNEFSTNKIKFLKGSTDQKKRSFINYFTYRGWENNLIYQKLKDIS